MYEYVFVYTCHLFPFISVAAALCVAALLMSQLLLVIVGRMAKFVAVLQRI